MKFNETWKEARSQGPLPSLCFPGRLEKQDGRPSLWLAETFLTSPLKMQNRIQQNMRGSKISVSSNKYLFFRPIGKTRWLPWPLIGWDIFDFSPEAYIRNLSKLDRKQDLSVLYQFCVFQADWKNKMAALASNWLRHFCMLLWNHWNEFIETWQEAIQRNLTGNKISMSLPVLCFSGWSENQDGHPVGFVDKGGTLYLSARYVALWASCENASLSYQRFNLLFIKLQFKCVNIKNKHQNNLFSWCQMHIPAQWNSKWKYKTGHKGSSNLNKSA